MIHRPASHRLTSLGMGFLVVIAMSAGVAQAAVLGPYAVDATTLHLWHMDEAAGATSVADAPVAVPLTMQGVLNGMTLGNASAGGFGSSGDFSLNAGSFIGSAGPPASTTANPPHRPILLAAPALATADGDAISTATLASPPGAGVQGAFTYEAIIKYDANFDVTAGNFRTTAVNASNAGTVAGNAIMDIMSGEGEGNAFRNFEWSINQRNNATPMRMLFNNLHGASGGQSNLVANIPLTGPNAVNNTDWFHVAVTYNGLEGTIGNLKMYFTKVDPANTVANLIGSLQMNSDLISGSTDFAIGNQARAGNNEAQSFFGRIDEVRISSVERYPNQFIFGIVPEPNTIVLVGMAMTIAVMRRRAR